MRSIILPIAEDLHIHLRDGELLKFVAPLVKAGGAGRVLVMPNLKPYIENTEQALNYKEQLQLAEPDLEYLMTLYLNPNLTVTEIKKAAENGIIGIKSYPRGVTTNSENGLENYEIYYPIFAEMEKQNLVLNIHGEMPSNEAQNICIMNAEEHFLPNLERIHHNFPKLRIVLEHITSKAAVELIKKLGSTVAATITAHHLELTVDDWAGQNHNYCKPVAKYPIDRQALREVIKQGNSKFFLGSDSAPHLKSLKENACACAGVFSSSHLMAYLAEIFDKLNCLEHLENFSSRLGQNFYQLKPLNKYIKLINESNQIPNSFKVKSLSDDLIPFWAGKNINWKVEV